MTAFLTDLATHMTLDAIGAGTFACLYLGCKNPAHQHRPLVRWIASNRSARISLFVVQMVVVGTVTIKLVG